MGKKRLLIIISVYILFYPVFYAAATDIAAGREYTIKYTMYIGLNDKETYTQLIPSEEALDKATAIILKYVDGFTGYQARGVFEDEKGILTYENSLVFEFLYASGQQMTEIMDEVLAEFNKTSVLLQETRVKSVFYEGLVK